MGLKFPKWAVGKFAVGANLLLGAALAVFVAVTFANPVASAIAVIQFGLFVVHVAVTVKSA